MDYNPGKKAITPADAPCKGIRVIEFASMVSGPFAGQILGDMGAEVIKIELPEGDPLRLVHPQEQGLAAFFVAVNRNKKSISLDLKSEAGKAIARKLLLSADVVIENFRPAVMAKLGLGYEQLKSLNPGLVYGSITGYGTSGPYANRPAYDQTIQPLCGLMVNLAEIAKQDRPQPIRNYMADKSASMTLVNGVLAALLSRERNGGVGQQVSVSLLDSFSAFALVDLMKNNTFQRQGAGRIPEYDLYCPIQTADGYVMGMLMLDSQFKGLCKTCEREDLLEDERFATSWSRLSNYEAMWQEMEQGTLKQTTKALVERAAANNVPLAPVNSIQQFFDDPQAEHNSTFFDIEHAVYGTVRQINHPIKYSTATIDVNCIAPALGEHTDQVLGELGFAAAEIASLREAGSVG
ncbi:MAG: CoA transferase [Gammaproteobacteria bacterium]|nr:CoA transferase [Gammaproteobacteria bacterium]